MATAPVQIRLGKKTTVAPRTPLVLSWNPRKKARYYNVQLFRGKRNVLSSWPGGPVVSLTGTWNWEGAKRKLVAGKYEWFVWPGFGKRANSKFGNLIGNRQACRQGAEGCHAEEEGKEEKEEVGRALAPACRRHAGGLRGQEEPDCAEEEERSASGCDLEPESDQRCGHAAFASVARGRCSGQAEQENRRQEADE